MFPHPCKGILMALVVIALIGLVGCGGDQKAPADATKEVVDIVKTAEDAAKTTTAPGADVGAPTSPAGTPVEDPAKKPTPDKPTQVGPGVADGPGSEEPAAVVPPPSASPAQYASALKTVNQVMGAIVDKGIEFTSIAKDPAQITDLAAFNKASQKLNEIVAKMAEMKAKLQDPKIGQDDFNRLLAEFNTLGTQANEALTSMKGYVKATTTATKPAPKPAPATPVPATPAPKPATPAPTAPSPAAATIEAARKSLMDLNTAWDREMQNFEFNKDVDWTKKEYVPGFSPAQGGVTLENYKEMTASRLARVERDKQEIQNLITKLQAKDITPEVIKYLGTQLDSAQKDYSAAIKAQAVLNTGFAKSLKTK